MRPAATSAEAVTGAMTWIATPMDAAVTMTGSEVACGNPAATAAIRDFVLDTVEGIRRIPAEQWRGELGFLAAISSTVHRLSLEMSDRQASRPRWSSALLVLAVLL